MNPRPLPEEVRPAVDRWTHLPSSSTSGWSVERGLDPKQNAPDPRRPTEVLPNPWLAGLTGTFPIPTAVTGSPEVGVQVLLDSRERSGIWSDCALRVGDIPSTLQEEWPLPRATCSGFASEGNCSCSVVKYFSFHLLVLVFV